MQRARKRFGQHFLHDRSVIERILRAIDPQPGDDLLEIGPGRGALTWPLLERCGRLTVVELDRDLAPILEREARGRGELEVINADILDLDLAAIAGGRKFRLVGNLPYNISTSLMFHLLQARCRCGYLFDVAPGCFRPPPRVNSAVIRLQPLQQPVADLGEADNFARIVQAAFGQRRKTVANSLKSIVDRETIAACGIDPGLRAENLEIADFASLSRSLGA